MKLYIVYLVYPKPDKNLSLLEDHDGPLSIFLLLILWRILIESLLHSSSIFKDLGQILKDLFEDLSDQDPWDLQGSSKILL